MEDKVKCRICNKEFSILNTHLLKIHGINAKEYLIKYPGSKTVSDTHCKMLSKYAKSAYDVTRGRTFDFINNKELRKLLQRDYKTAKVCLNEKLWKPSIILYGSIIEAILREIIKERTEKFYNVIEKSYKKKLITEKEYHNIHLVRDLRNIVHLHKELSEGEKINDYWAKTLADICESIIGRFRK